MASGNIKLRSRALSFPVGPCVGLTLLMQASVRWNYDSNDVITRRLIRPPPPHHHQTITALHDFYNYHHLREHTHGDPNIPFILLYFHTG